MPWYEELLIIIGLYALFIKPVMWFYNMYLEEDDDREA